MTSDDASIARRRRGERWALRGLEDSRVVRIEGFEEAVPVTADARDSYRRRFVTLLVDEGSERRGGMGVVVRAHNAFGETLALKVASDERPVDDVVEAAFREEYKNHLVLNGVRGFPRLYGFGHVGDAPAIVMEWIEGETLANAAGELSVDGDGRLSPLTAARIGRELFSLLRRMDEMGAGVIHRDISPANVMVRTSHLSVRQQAEGGVFDLCLIDFGSSVVGGPVRDGSLTSTRRTARAATADYAPPEMLTSDVDGVERLRGSSKIDVYAAGSVLYWLLCGRPPFDLSAPDVRSPYRAKVDGSPREPRCAHVRGCDLPGVLAAEPEVATDLAVALVDARPVPDEREVRQCLELVDSQLVDLVMACLEVRQERRPDARAMESALTAFCSCYAQNIARAIAGETLLPCTADATWFSSASPLALRRMLRSVGTALSLGVWTVVVVGTGVLLQGREATLYVGRVAHGITLAAPVVSLALALPAVVAILARGRDVGTRGGFLRGSAVLLSLSVLGAALSTRLGIGGANAGGGLLAASFASFASAWCPLVLDYATTVVPGLVHEARRRLPQPHDAGGGEGLPASDAGLLGETTSVPASDDMTYEVPDEDSDQ